MNTKGNKSYDLTCKRTGSLTPLKNTLYTIIWDAKTMSENIKAYDFLGGRFVGVIAGTTQSRTFYICVGADVNNIRWNNETQRKTMLSNFANTYISQLKYNSKYNYILNGMDYAIIENTASYRFVGYSVGTVTRGVTYRSLWS